MSKVFLKNLENERIDCEYYNPKYDFLKKLKNAKYSVVELKVVAKPIMGKTPAKAEYSSEGIPIVKFGSLTGNGINWNKVQKAKLTFYEKNKDKVIQMDDIIVTSSAHSPEYIGRKIDIVNKIPEEIDKALFVGELMVIRPDKDKILPEYLYYYLKSNLGRLQIRQMITGQTAHLYPEDVDGMKIIVPEDKEIQEKIIAPIKKEINEKIKYLEKEKSRLKGFDNEIVKMLDLELPEFKKEKVYLAKLEQDRIDALFNSKYFKKLVNALKSIPHKALNEVADEIKTKKPLDAENYRIIDLRKISDFTGQVTPIKVKKLDSAKISLIKDSLIINKLSPTKRKTIIIDDTLSDCVASTEFMVVIPKNKNDLKYLKAILRSKLIVSQWQFQITGSNPSRERIHESLVMNTTIPFPEEKLRNQISKMHEEITGSVIHAQDGLRESLKDALENFLTDIIK